MRAVAGETKGREWEDVRRYCHHADLWLGSTEERYMKKRLEEYLKVRGALTNGAKTLSVGAAPSS